MTYAELNMGPIMLDVASHELSAEEKDVLDHPSVGGVILFTRNFFDLPQLSGLIGEIRSHARHPVLIAVDHEGGRVQRFREGFSRIPAMGSIWQNSQENLAQAEHIATELGWLMAAECQAMDIDVSFAPVLDINGNSEVIGDRSFHALPDKLIPLATAFIRGMHAAGMKATGKHFPGHGNVKEDSHIAMPVDKRAALQVFDVDMAVFKAIHEQGLLDAVMPAHVIYPDVDSLPAGFSKVWIREILRGKLGFDGVVFSDDLSMQGAAQLGSYTERATAALSAGCDMALVCNAPQGAIEVLDNLPIGEFDSARTARMMKSSGGDLNALRSTERHSQALRMLETLDVG